jgi:5'-deoxynucleotidase YfbR-like HD superfamily hydrolase
VEGVNVEDAVQSPVVLPLPLGWVEGLRPGGVIHEYSMPLGGERWLDAKYVQTGGSPPPGGQSFGWVFKRGGRMQAGDWRDVLGEGLQGVTRFGGRGMSVASHSVLLQRYMHEREYGTGAEILALLHDTPETLGIGDMNTNLKKLIGHTVRSYEDDLLAFLLTDIGVAQLITEDDWSAVHAADKVLGAAEALLMRFQNANGYPIGEDSMMVRWLRPRLMDITEYDDVASDAYATAWDSLIPTLVK